MLRTIAIALALIAPTPVSADFQTGNQLFSKCIAEGTTEPAFCLGYLAGVADVMDVGNPVNRFRACVPGGVVMGQMKDIFVNALQRNPAERHYGAAGLAASALAGAFPCK